MAAEPATPAAAPPQLAHRVRRAARGSGLRARVRAAHAARDARVADSRARRGAGDRGPAPKPAIGRVDPDLGRVPVLAPRSLYGEFGLRQGWRTRGNVTTKRDGVVRLLHLGDGVTARAAVLQPLRELWRGGDVEFLNAGVPGFDPAAVRRVLSAASARSRARSRRRVAARCGTNDAARRLRRGRRVRAVRARVSRPGRSGLVCEQCALSPVGAARLGAGRGRDGGRPAARGGRARALAR